MRFCCLGSGSRGNAYAVESDSATILIDCGFSLPSLTKRMGRRFLSLHEIDAVLVSHEHGDHIAGLGKMRGPDVYMTSGTATELKMPDACLIRAGASFSIRDVRIMPVTVPHDAREPVQFVISDGGNRAIGIFTDLGHVTPAVLDAAQDLDALVVECNYSNQLLQDNRRYPERVKQRIASDYGHLENEDAARFVERSISPRLRAVVAAHLSEENNTPHLARLALERVAPPNIIAVADQEAGTDWIAIA